MKPKEFWIVDNGEEPCLAFREKKGADGITTYKDHYHVQEVPIDLDRNHLMSELRELVDENDLLKRKLREAGLE